MNSLFGPPELLSGYAVAEDGSGPDLSAGTHLRIFAGLGPSFPLAPFAVYKLASRPSEPHSRHVSDRSGIAQPGLDLSSLGAADVILGLGDADDERTVRLQLTDPEGGLEGVALLGPKGKRTIVARQQPPWLFSAPLMHRLRVWGRSSHLGIGTRRLSVYDLLEGHHELAGLLSLPIKDDHLWYTHGNGRPAAEEQVKSGAPPCLRPMDRPDGQFVTVSPAQEALRVAAMLTSGQLGGGLESLLARLVDDPQPPWTQFERQPMQGPNGRSQVVRAPRLGTLQTAAMDPGLARFFGFATRFDDLPDLEGAGGWDTLAVVGLLALDPREYLRRGLDLAVLIDDRRPGAAGLLESLMRALEDTSGTDPRPAIAERMRFVRDEGLVAAPFVTMVAPVPPWLPPLLASPQVVDHRWQTATDGIPSSKYRASFAFPQPPLAAMAALAARLDGEWVARHDHVTVEDGELGYRAVPHVLGHERDSSARVRRQGSGTFEPAGLLSDEGIPDVGAIDCRAWASDMFGRFGDPIEFTIQAPPRPAPPPPVLRYHFQRAVIDPTATVELSPGSLRLTIATPHRFPADRFTAAEAQLLGSAVVLPRIDDLAAGSLEVARLTVGLADGQHQTVDVSEPGFAEIELPLPPLAPQAMGRWTLVGYLTDSAGVDSAIATVPVEVADVRPPRVYPAGIGLFWSSAPGPSPDVELKLSWPAAAGSLHRVYLTDQQGLGLGPQDVAEEQPGVAPSRGRVAAAGCQRVLGGGQVERKAFRLLTEQPVKAGPNGAVFVTRLPRSLETVQFLRVVPLGPDGAEPPFDACGIVAAAVPDSRRPVAPRIEGEVNQATGSATLRMVTDGFDRAVLQRDEPGLFEPGAAGGEPPRFRIRRAVGAVADPIYAPKVGEGPLHIPDTLATPAVFVATFTDDNGGRGLEPFVRYVYWAEVRLPPERRVPAGFALLDPPGGVTAPDPVATQPHQRPLSPPSAPRVLMHLPPNPPDAPAGGTITVVREPGAVVDEVKLTVAVADAPRAHALAIGPYRAAIWYQWPGHSIQPAASEADWPDVSDGVVPLIVKVPMAVDPAAALKLRLAFIDPAGRVGKITSLDV